MSQWKWGLFSNTSTGQNWENPWDKTHKVTTANCFGAFEDFKQDLPQHLKTPVVFCYAPRRAAKPQTLKQCKRDTCLKQLLCWPPDESGFCEKGHFSQQQANKKLTMLRIAERSIWLSSKCVLLAKQCVLACGQVEKLVPFPLLWMELNSSINGSVSGLLPSRSCILLSQQGKHLLSSSRKSPGEYTAT